MANKFSDLPSAEDIIKKEQEAAEEPEQLLTETDIAELGEELEKEKKFGDRGLEAAAIGTASGLTFGLSNQLLRKLGFSAEELREIDDRNKAASIAGEVTGTLGGLLATGGTSALAKGAGAAGKAVRGVAKAGTATEQLTAKALNKIIAETGERKFAKDVIKKAIPNAAGSAVEGAAFGTGQLIKEDALGTAEFNAENLVTSLGGGALLAGTLGAGIGATLPVFGAVSRVGRKGSEIAKRKASDLLDSEEAALDLIGASITQRANLKKFQPQLVRDLPDFLRERGGLGKFTSTEQLLDNLQKVKVRAGETIPRVLKEVDEAAALNPSIMPTRAQVFDPIIKTLDDKYIKKYAGKAAFRDQLRKVRQLRDDLINERFSGDLLSAAKLQELRKMADDLAKFEKTPGSITMGQEAARDVRSGLRSSIDNVAERASASNPRLANLSKELKNANRDFSIISQIEKPLGKKVEKSEAFLSLSDIALGGLGGASFGPQGLLLAGANKFLKSDFRRRLAVTSFMEKQNQVVSKQVTKAINDFFKKTAGPASTTAKASLVKSAIAEKVENGKIKKPQNKQQAFRNIRDNLRELSTDPEKLQRAAVKSTAGLTLVAPNTAGAAQEIMVRAIAFLQDKLPVELQPNEELAALYRPRELSDLELAKFERYVQAVESPMSLLEDLQSGTATTEQVEAVKAVYPDLYERVVQETYQYIGEQGERISYNKRVQLGTLLGVPTDTSLRPDALADLQSNFGKAGEGEDPQQQGGSTAAQGQAPGRLSVTGLREMDIAARENSEAQNFISRKRN